MTTTEDRTGADGRPEGFPVDANADFTSTLVPRTLGQDILDTIRSGAGAPACSNCGHTDEGDGSVAFTNLLFDGQPVEVLVLTEPVDPDDPNGEQSIMPVALVLDDALFERLTTPDAPIDTTSAENTVDVGIVRESLDGSVTGFTDPPTEFPVIESPDVATGDGEVPLVDPPSSNVVG
jgi:hypothetical protein